jgi:hypothetical protein
MVKFILDYIYAFPYLKYLAAVSLCHAVNRLSWNFETTHGG